MFKLQNAEILQNVIDVSLERNNRAYGKTTNAVKFAKDNDGYLVCINSSMAMRVSSEWGIDSFSINSFVNNKMSGNSKRMVIDQDAILHKVSELLRDVDQIDNLLKSSIDDFVKHGWSVLELREHLKTIGLYR